MESAAVGFCSRFIAIADPHPGQQLSQLSLLGGSGPGTVFAMFALLTRYLEKLSRAAKCLRANSSADLQLGGAVDSASP